MDQRVAVVVATRNRRDELLASLGELVGLPEGPEVLVVDNASSDGSAAAVRSCLPQVRVVALATNRAAAARTIAARLVRSPYVAFADDDSSWEPGALSRAADLLDRHPDVGLVAGKVLVGWARHPDPVAGQMAASPLGRHPGTGLPRVLGFLACAAVVRRSAYLAVGGFPERLGVGGEETVVALDLAAAGWELVYDAGVVALHRPSPRRDMRARSLVQARNQLWSAWLRLPFGQSRALLAEMARSPRSWPALAAALRGGGWTVRHRRRAPPLVAGRFALLAGNAK